MSAWRSMHPPSFPRLRLVPLPSWPECCRCSCKSHPNTRSLEQPFFFPFCRDFMARAPGIWPLHLCPPKPLTYQSPMESQSVVGFGPAPEGQGSKLEVEGGLGNGQQHLPLGAPWGHTEVDMEEEATRTRA